MADILSPEELAHIESRSAPKVQESSPASVRTSNPPVAKAKEVDQPAAKDPEMQKMAQDVGSALKTVQENSPTAVQGLAKELGPIAAILGGFFLGAKHFGGGGNTSPNAQGATTERIEPTLNEGPKTISDRTIGQNVPSPVAPEIEPTKQAVPITSISQSDLDMIAASEAAKTSKEVGPVAPKEPVAPVAPTKKEATKEATKVAKDTAVVPWARDASGNIVYPEGMTPAAKAGHQAFAKQFPAVSAELEAKGQFGILGAGSGDNNLFSAYGKDTTKTIRNELLEGGFVGTHSNYQDNLRKEIAALSPEEGLGKQLADLRVSNPHGSVHGQLGTPAAMTSEGKLITGKNNINKIIKGGGAATLLMAIANAANASTQQTAPSQSIKPPENKDGAFVGYPQLQRQSASMRKAAEGRVPENIKDPATYAFVQGLISGNPESDISVLSEKRKKASDAAYYGAQLSNLMQIFGR